MLVYVLNRHGKPLMPCAPVKARHLLKEGKARVVCRTPFTIKLLFGSAGYRQAVIGGVDSGSKTVGVAATSQGRVLYQAEVRLRDDVADKLEQRAMFRRTRRARKTRYRPARFANRATSRRDGRLPPSIRSKVDSHLREMRWVERRLPVSRWRVEVADFDIHKLVNPTVSGREYQNGPQKGWYNVKAYVLHRDGHACQSGRKGVPHSSVLHVHHVVFRSNGGTDAPENLITLCEACHADLHASVFSLPTRRRKTTRHATAVGLVKGGLQASGAVFEPTFGYETKWTRERLGLAKSHAHDAVAIASPERRSVAPDDTVWLRRHVACGDYQQTSGKRSEKRIPTGKLFGLRKFDLVQTPKAVGFVKGKRERGWFVLMGIDGKPIADIDIRKNARRLAARASTLTWRQRLLPVVNDRVPAAG